MKKILLSMILSALLLGVAIGQSLVLSNTDGIEIPANSVITEMVEPGSGTQATHLHVTNISTEPIGVKVKKVENYLEADDEGGMLASICWAGQCFGPNVYVSPNADTLQPNEVNEEGFSGDLFMNSYVGISSVTYVFFDENNPVDSVSVIVNYLVTDTPSSFSLSLDGEDFEDNESITVSGTQGAAEIVAHVHISNDSDEDISVKVRRIETNMPAETSSYFCWVSCYPPFVNVSPDALLMSPGDLSTLFTGDYAPNGVEGDASISYVFFDQDDLSNFSTINVNFVESTVGIEANNFENIFLSNAYPNPSNNSVSFDYDLKDIDNAKLVVYNLLGSTVRNIQVRDDIGKIKMDVADLDEGIYFYSLLVNNETIRTQKLVVKH